MILAKTLTYSGILPFLACAALGFFAETGVDTIHIAIAYGAIIISFLCGIHWAAYIFFAEKCPCHLLITSNVVALLAWGSLLFPGQLAALLLQAACFLYLLLLDSKLRDAGLYPNWFYLVRRNATAIVVVCLAILMGSA